MSLSRTLLNGGVYGSTIDTTKYSHSDGAFRIARESIEDLHEIFIESFYNVEQAELAAACEGVTLEESQYVAVAEAAIGGALDKIKGFFKKLWEKVKGFFANVRKFIDSIFKSGKDFANKYANEIKALPSFKDYKVKMYNYNDSMIENPDFIAVDVEAVATKVSGINGASGLISDIADYNGTDKTASDAAKNKYTGNASSYAAPTAAKPTHDDDKEEKQVLGAICGDASVDPDDFDKWVFAKFRNGAEDSTDMEEDDYTNSDVKNWAKTLQDTKASSAISKAQTKSDKAFKEAIKKVDKFADEMEKAKDANDKAIPGMSVVVEEIRHFSSLFSTAQNFQNTMISGWKTAYGERDAAYKKAIYGAFAYAKKYKKNNPK